MVGLNLFVIGKRLRTVVAEDRWRWDVGDEKGCSRSSVERSFQTVGDLVSVVGGSA